MTKIHHICVIGSGYDVHTCNRTKIFAEKGYKVTFITDYESKINGIHEILLQMPNNPMLAQFIGTLLFIRAIRNVTADVYLVHFPRRNSSWAAAIANVRPLLISVMGGDVNFEEYGAPLSQFQRDMTLSVLQKSDFILSKTYYLSRIMQELGISENKIERIIWGIDRNHWYKRTFEMLKPVRGDLNLSTDDLVLFSPKMLLPFYNIHIIIDALPLVLKAFPNVKLILSERRANSEYQQQLMTKIEAHGLNDHIIFVGDIPHDLMAAYYSLSDVVVTLATNDGLPHAMLEAMACEVPYILGDLPRYREFVQHKESVYFVEFDSVSVANGIIELLSDQDLYARIVSGANNLIDEMADIDKEAQRVIDLVEPLVSDQPAKKTGIDIRLLLRFFILGLQQTLKKAIRR